LISHFPISTPFPRMSATTAVSLLRQYLEAKREGGRTHVAVSSAAVKLLGGLRAKAEHQIRAVDEVDRRGEVVAEARVAVPAASEARNPLILPVEGASKAEKLQKLRALAEQSPAARELGTLRTTMVFAVGNPDARLMLVGEAPGFQEEKQGEPFVGPAGEKLTQILKAMGVRAGVSDLFLPVPAGGKHGLWLELKALGGAISTEQRVWLGEMRKNGYSAFLCVGWEDARDRIVEYLGGEFPAVDMSEQIGRVVGAEKK
jgi:hypothetical protein